MARILPVKRKKGIVYKAEIRLKGHPYLCQTFDRLSEAQRWAEDTEATLRSGGYIGETPPDDIAFGKALDRYELEVTSQKRPNTRSREITSANTLRIFFAGLNLKEITPARVAAFRDKRLKTVGPSTIQKDLALLSHLFTIARTEWAMEVNNPVASIRKPAKPDGRLRLLSKNEARHLLEICKKSRNEKLYPYVQLLLHTGMRPSEAAGLIWGQVDIDARIIDLTITENKAPQGSFNHHSHRNTASNHAGREWNKSLPVFLPLKISSTIRRRPNLFFRRAFDNAVKKAKIEDFHMHDLRHTAASYLLMAGVDLSDTGGHPGTFHHADGAALHPSSGRPQTESC